MAGSVVIRLVTWSYMSAITSILIVSAEMISFIGWCGNYANETLHRPPFDDSSHCSYLDHV